ncbi:MAG: hypothetical protein ACKN81_15885, partial [Pirellulaceae bacterium]
GRWFGTPIDPRVPSGIVIRSEGMNRSVAKCKACDGSHPPPWDARLAMKISPSPWEGREERAGRAFCFCSIHRGPFCLNGGYCVPLPASSFLLRDPPPGRVKQPISPSPWEGDWVLWPLAFLESWQ